MASCNRITRTVSCSGVQVIPGVHPDTQQLWLVRTKLSSVPQNAFHSLSSISHIFISDDDAIRSVEKHSFYNLSSVAHIQITGVKTLSYIHEEAFKDLPNLKYLGISNTGLTLFPGLRYIRSMREDFILEIVENVLIRVIPANSFFGISVNALTVMLNDNGVKEIQRFAFNGSRLEEVYLQRNLDLKHIDEFSFYGVIHGPTHLDLSETQVHSLPSVGLESIERLRAERTWTLEALPPSTTFPHLQRAELTFPSHCCGLKTLKRWRGLEAVFCNRTWSASGKLQESSVTSTHPEQKVSQRLQDIFDLQGAENTDYSLNNSLVCPNQPSQKEGSFSLDSSAEHLKEDFEPSLCNEFYADDGPSCSPVPDALNPCEDVMSTGYLRVLVWVVSLVAVSANLLVLVILLSCQQKLTVTRFLIGHLAFADTCMGMYLLLIASVDFHTRSRYHHFAISWQTGSGCNVAGMLSVFASELSVYTLTLITLQRWHAIFNAMRLDKKLRLRHAAVLMLIGWLICAIMAVLPVLGVNSYQKVSICLPVDTETAAARAYIVYVLMVNVFAFLVVCLCYVHIYCMVHRPQTSRCNTTMAKRMALLILTNFLCLAPVCFYGLSAAFHRPLMTVTDSKVLLVLFYPLNSCVHPFFYAILTKGFHRDITMLLSRIGLCQKQAYLYRS
ncbi:thyrotropin receptor-like [Melanotaenia boesemani]|uniref:thyrotropin receptor-like n=1 Tax=Melanotaenia boesemani TaxID=1250792 RepID=UPI001C0444FC|nr:thyrotropin receptor-like [Melanotaenia boesemani]